MPLPNLTHAVPVQIQSLDVANSHYDEELRELIQDETYHETITCPGQVMWIHSSRTTTSGTGIEEDSDGYVLFRNVDLATRQLVLKREDRFIRLGTVLVDVYIVALQPVAHYPDMGGPTMLKAFFKDRAPSRNSRGT